jgi:hypothetical protein
VPNLEKITAIAATVEEVASSFADLADPRVTRPANNPGSDPDADPNAEPEPDEYED